MNQRMLYLYCRGRARATAIQESLRPSRPGGPMLYEPAPAFEGQEGLSKIAVTVILVAVSVALVVAVVAAIAPAITNLANRTGSQIESVPLDFGQ